MITIRPSEDRGHTQIGWLDSRHSFSFDRYFDPKQTNFRSLRVINEDFVAPGAGFPMHAHRDMEILTYILEGALEHRDSMGNGSVMRPGEVQRMTAGTGVMHSEFNASGDQRVRFLQIWIIPESMQLKPGYEQKIFPKDGTAGTWQLLAARNPREGSLTIHQDAELYRARLHGGERLSYALKPGRHAWLQVADGALDLDGGAIHAGDGAAISDQSSFTLSASPGSPDAEVLLFDLA
jgi:hypothetical protein